MTISRISKVTESLGQIILKPIPEFLALFLENVNS